MALGTRIFSSTLLWSIVAVTLWFGRDRGVVLLATVVSIFTLREFYRLMRGCGYTPFAKLGMTVGGIVTLAPWIEAQAPFAFHSYHLIGLATAVFSIRLLGERTPETRVDALDSTLFGLIYVAFMISYYTRIAVPLPNDTVSATGRLLLCLWLIAVSKFSDMGGYLGGMMFGKHPMSPQISPKKTWEGFAGGIVASMGIGALLAYLCRAHLPPHMTPLVSALMAIPIALMSVVGDLVESVIKRRADIKDSGQMLPGQGGFFDMSDSLLLVAPLGYLFFGLP